MWLSNWLCHFCGACLGGAFGSDGKKITYPEYAHMYYRDFFYYTREKRSDASGDAGLIMSRPVDCTSDKYSKVCTPFSPRVCFVDSPHHRTIVNRLIQG
jgi:hypothetical protein